MKRDRAPERDPDPEPEEILDVVSGPFERRRLAPPPTPTTTPPRQPRS